MGKNGVKVIIRTRPTANFATNQLVIDSDDSTIIVHSNMSANGTSNSPTKYDSSLSLTNSTTAVSQATPSNRKDCWKFRFHQVLHNASQDKVYEAIARDIVHGATVEGINGTILAYGQTGAGKSFTMIGDTRNYQHRGIAPRAIAQVYEEVENRIEIQYTIKVSYMEIYNDRIYDLLENTNSGGQSQDKGEFVVVEDARGTYVRGLTQVEATSEQEALDQLFHGELQRTVAEHQLNKRSNRSHCIFTLHISQKSRAGGNERVTHSKLHLVDLAGSERLKKTMMDDNFIDSKAVSSTGGAGNSISTIKKESMYINQSLSFLEQCIVALGSKETRHIPYRQTKLTNVLKDSLGGNSNTLMFACIWGESKHLEETISTLKLAQRMMRVQNEIATIVESDPQILLRKYEKQIKELKHELIMHDALVERTGVVYDEHTPEQKYKLMQMVRQFVDASTPAQEDEVLKLNSIHEIRELFRQFKILLKNAEGEGGGMGGRGSSDGHSLRAGSAGSTASRSQSSRGSRVDIHGHHHDNHTNNSDEFVGEEEPGTVGFGLGIVPGAARPSTMDTSKRIKDSPTRSSGGTINSNMKQQLGESDSGGRSHHRSPSPTRPVVDSSMESKHRDFDDAENIDREDADGDSSPSNSSHSTRLKNEAFQYFKIGPGKKLHRNLQEEKEKIFDVKQKVKQITSRVNAVKIQIDTVRAKLEEKRSHRSGGGSSPSKKIAGSVSPGKSAPQQREEIVDEEEFILMTTEREAKRDYRSLFDDLKEAKAELEFTNRSVELLRMRVVREFEDWYNEEGKHFARQAASKDDDDDHGNLPQHPSMMVFGFGSKEDKLDDGEKFDQMEMERIRAQDPDSLAFFQAQKKMRQQQTGSSAQSKKIRTKRGT